MTIETPKSFTETEYFCPKCKLNFVVYREPGTQYCAWCGTLTKETGQVSKLEGDFVVVYKDNVEISRFLRKDIL
jgi:uncharacterized Zn finger protein (UPF0148 family)